MQKLGYQKMKRGTSPKDYCNIAYRIIFRQNKLRACFDKATQKSDVFENQTIFGAILKYPRHNKELYKSYIYIYFITHTEL